MSASRDHIRLAVLTLHPIHYQAALWGRLAQEPDLDLEVWFCSPQGLDTADPVSGYGQAVEWGLPLLTGFRSRFFRNLPLSRNPSSFWCRVNPGILAALWRRRYDALFVHSYHNWTQILAIMLAHRLGMRVLVRSEPTPLIAVSAGRQSIKQVLLPWLFRQIDAFMAIGSLNRDYYRHFGVPDRKIFSMPYAVDNDFFFGQRRKWAPHRDRIKAEFGIAADQVILYVGRFQARKRVMDLIRAYEALNLPGVDLALVGLGEEFEACRQYVSSKGLIGVRFLGFLSQMDLPRAYALADVLVLPSEEEPWGLVVNEAMCFALPVVVSDRVGAAADLVHPGRNGFVYPPGDLAALTAALHRTLAAGAKDKMGQASLEIIRGWGFAQDVAALRQALQLPAVAAARAPQDSGSGEN